MKFNVTVSPYNGIIQTCELLLDLGNGGISGNPVLFAQFTNLINNDAYDDVIADILRYAGDYNWDDSNYTLSPIATVNLVTTPGSEQSVYALPVANDGTYGSTDDSSFLRLTGIKVKGADGYWSFLRNVTEDHYDIPLETVYNTPGMPVAYRELGTNVVIYPAPLASQVTATKGLRMEFIRDKVDFTVSGTDTQMPGFPSIYHYLLALKASETWAGIKGMKQLPLIQQKIAKFTANLGWGMSNREKNVRQRVIPRNAGGNVGGWSRNYE